MWDKVVFQGFLWLIMSSLVGVGRMLVGAVFLGKLLSNYGEQVRDMIPKPSFRFRNKRNLLQNKKVSPS